MKRSPLVVFLCFSVLLCFVSANFSTLRVTSRSRTPSQFGRINWQTTEKVEVLNVNETALVVVDMWDKHWCLTASQRVNELAEWANEIITAARAAGITIIHAPSDCQYYYTHHPARLRVLHLPDIEPPMDLPHPNPPLPVDDSDGGCDWPNSTPTTAWTRENPLIHIDEKRDYILADDTREAYNVYSHLQLKNIIYLGVHLNMCVLNRNFAIKQAWRWGFRPLFNRDGIDAMYNPARPPYVSHWQGVELLVNFVETFWAPSISVYDLMDPSTFV